MTENYTKVYPIKSIGKTEFEAQIGNPVGLFLDDGKPYVVLEHTKRYSEKENYKVLSIEDGKEEELKYNKYLGTFRPQGVMVRHVYITTDNGIIVVPR
jgi:hypothetical protein